MILLRSLNNHALIYYTFLFPAVALLDNCFIGGCLYMPHIGSSYLPPFWLPYLASISRSFLLDLVAFLAQHWLPLLAFGCLFAFLLVKMVAFLAQLSLFPCHMLLLCQKQFVGSCKHYLMRTQMNNHLLTMFFLGLVRVLRGACLEAGVQGGPCRGVFHGV